MKYFGTLTACCAMLLLGFLFGAGLVQRDCPHAAAPPQPSPGYALQTNVPKFTLKIEGELEARLLKLEAQVRLLEAQKLDTTLPYRPPPPMPNPSYPQPGWQPIWRTNGSGGYWEVPNGYSTNVIVTEVGIEKAVSITNVLLGWIPTQSQDGRFKGVIYAWPPQQLPLEAMGGNLYRSVTNQWFTNDNGLLREIRK